MWGDSTVWVTLNRKRPLHEPIICNRISRARLTRLHPIDFALELRASADTALAEGLSGSTKQAYNSHVNYFYEFCQSITLDIRVFGAPVSDGGLPPADEETVSSSFLSRSPSACDPYSS